MCNSVLSLHMRTEEPHLNTVMYRVEQGANKEARDDDNWTPLHYAAANGRLDTVMYPVEQDANKEAIDDQN